ncbi:hypothetical protein OKA05_04010 [Luteolibacter arcticus]|uniref:Slp family lipoprotein n=1 Tax=Luteolibacter arcticus TaxID=1581411 RepID=A0ABT3GE47_9BACT|nr:hypothetical protein [Luteolibacter arcticus]MCW1921703.1 hypothetical protein [Luteolibacter arcticus]
MSMAKTMVVALALLACSCSYDRSDHPVIGEVVGKRLTTKRPTVLAWGYTLRGGSFLLDSSRPMLRLHDAAEYGKYAKYQNFGAVEPVVARLPAGTPVKIDSIYVFTSDSSTVLTGFGVIGEGDAARVFYYPMGHSGELEIAPWEPPLRPVHRSYDVVYERAE